MKIVIYKHDDIVKLTNAINSIAVRGFDQARLIALAGDILDSGEIKERHHYLTEKEKNDID